MHGGILLHATSIPGNRGIGELGADAVDFLDWLVAAGCGWWQVLPLGPTGFADSPYQSFSSFAGNPYLIDLGDLIDSGLLGEDEVAAHPSWEDSQVDYATVIPWKTDLIDTAHSRLRSGAGPPGMEGRLDAFTRREAWWLDDFTRFMALKDRHDGAPWHQWPLPLRRRLPDAMAAVDDGLTDLRDRHAFRQFIFYRQWQRLRAAAAHRSIRIIGDIPIFAAHDSADVWTRPDLFVLDEAGRPTVVAGVPPDLFSDTGQLWGNPLYRWRNHDTEGYAWWMSRLRAVLRMVDVVRIDHFRGFVNYWEIPAGADNAVEGTWVDGPGMRFFSAVRAALGDLPIIAEDLGEHDPRVPELRDRLGLPGMKILQTAFADGPENDSLPHRYQANCVAYTGTHDNDTTSGWWDTASAEERTFACSYLGVDGSDIARDLIEAAWRSAAGCAIAPAQDVAGLGSEARMNFPGIAEGNWRWRATWSDLSSLRARRMRRLATETARLPAPRTAT